MTTKIPLDGGLVALVDDADAHLVLPFRWRVLQTRHNLYAVRCWGLPYFMHRQLMGLDFGDLRDVDHRNHDGLDNRRSNMRVCSRSQNCANKLLRSDNTTGWKGVSRAGRRWAANIWVKGKAVYLGTYGEPWAAALAYDLAAVQHFGEFACTNGDLGHFDRLCA